MTAVLNQRINHFSVFCHMGYLITPLASRYIISTKSLWLTKAECGQNSRKNFNFIQNGIMFFSF
jgi:hypothetical protein